MNKRIATILGLAASSAAAFGQTIVSSDITSDTTWTTAGSPYILDTTIFVKNNATLTINPGVIVRGEPRSGVGEAGAPGSLVITKTGKIIASGDASSTIIFTTAAVDNNGDGLPDDFNEDSYLDQYPGFVSPSDLSANPNPVFLDATPASTPLAPISGGVATDQLWGGLIILGNAPINVGSTGGTATGTPGLAAIEGLTSSADTQYGGKFVNDNSGILRFVSVRHGGEELGSDNEINGVTLGGVGAGTVLEYCEVYMNYDDGFEWFGGTVDSNHLVVTFCGDDSFDGDQGWTGKNQFWFAVLPYFDLGGRDGDKGFEFDGDDGTGTAVQITSGGVIAPYSNYEIYNATIIGNQGATGVTGPVNGQIDLKSRYSGTIGNGYFVNNALSGSPIINGGTLEVNIINSTFASPAIDTAATNAALASFTSASGNVVNATNTVKGDDQAVIGGLNPRPALAFTGITSNLTLPSGYVQTNFRGAFDPSDSIPLWTNDWAVLNLLGILVD